MKFRKIGKLKKSREKTIAVYSKYLKGKKIFIDPGHGGTDKRNKSKSGKVIEAIVNLNVALHLRDYLEVAGATVFMSRDSDETVDLKYRSVLANKSGAEIFISIHHNASPTFENNWSNYTSTFYHSRSKLQNYIPASHDMAKFVQRDLSYVMRNSGGLGSFDGTSSDFKIYPNKGFSVLRESKMPAILIECSFFNHINEERRLQIDEFNQIQAWGIFRGLGKYYLNCVPKIKLLQDESLLRAGKLLLVFLIDDRYAINKSSIKVSFNNIEVEYEFDKSQSKVTVYLEDVAVGEHKIELSCKNINGNNSYPFEKTVKIK